MSDRYPVLAAEAQAELEITRSRFLGWVAPAPSKDAAERFVASARAAHPEATHVCSAYLVGPPGSTRCVGFSDDGEPHASAGRPMFDVIAHSGIGDLVAAVVRWYGGTKLGRGGLVRAYGGAVQAALQNAGLEEKVAWAELRVELDYGAVPALERRLAALGGEVLEPEWGARVRLRVRVPEAARSELEGALADLTRGAAALEELEGPTD